MRFLKKSKYDKFFLFLHFLLKALKPFTSFFHRSSTRTKKFENSQTMFSWSSLQSSLFMALSLDKTSLTCFSNTACFLQSRSDYNTLQKLTLNFRSSITWGVFLNCARRQNKTRIIINWNLFLERTILLLDGFILCLCISPTTKGS